MKKEIILLLDGSGNDLRKKEFLTNIGCLQQMNILGCVSEEVRSGNPQHATEGWTKTIYPPSASSDLPRHVYYDCGVGYQPPAESSGMFSCCCAATRKISFMWAFVTASGIGENVQQAYRFLVDEYEEGDRVFIFGFSRGAYTAWLLVNLLDDVGLINRRAVADGQDMEALIQDACEMMQKQTSQPLPPYFFPKEKLVDFITFLGLYDFVQGSTNVEDYDVDFVLPFIIARARHAISLDEPRKGFAVSMWTRQSSNQDSEQRIFSGEHSNIGGGNDKHRKLSNATLFWMMDSSGLKLVDGWKNEFTTPDPLSSQSDILHSGAFSKGSKLTWKKLGEARRRFAPSVDDLTVDGSVWKRVGQNVTAVTSEGKETEIVCRGADDDDIQRFAVNAMVS